MGKGSGLALANTLMAFELRKRVHHTWSQARNCAAMMTRRTLASMSSTDGWGLPIPTGTAKEITALKRLYGKVDDDLAYAIDMAAVGHPMQAHVGARLQRREARQPDPGRQRPTRVEM